MRLGLASPGLSGYRRRVGAVGGGLPAWAEGVLLDGGEVGTPHANRADGGAPGRVATTTADGGVVPTMPVLSDLAAARNGGTVDSAENYGYGGVNYRPEALIDSLGDDTPAVAGSGHQGFSSTNGRPPIQCWFIFALKDAATIDSILTHIRLDAYGVNGGVRCAYHNKLEISTDKAAWTEVVAAGETPAGWFNDSPEAFNWTTFPLAAHPTARYVRWTVLDIHGAASYTECRQIQVFGYQP